MTRRLSQQQRLILGLAVAVSRHHYGEPKAHVPRPLPNWRMPVALTARPPDVTANLCAHFIHGVTVDYWKMYARSRVGGVGAMKRTPEAKAAISSASRALVSMERSGLLCYRGYRQWARGFVYGYLLTAAGLDIGRQYVIELPADIEHRLIAFGWIRDAQGCSRWGRDDSIPLTFEHAKLLTRRNGCASSTVAAEVCA